MNARSAEASVKNFAIGKVSSPEIKGSDGLLILSILISNIWLIPIAYTCKNIAAKKDVNMSVG